MENGTDPTGRNQHEPGAKLDSGKVQAGVLGDFGLALMEVAKVGTGGVFKYSRGGWQTVPNGLERYEDAFWRHLLVKQYVEIDPDYGLKHLAHLAWNVLATLETEIRNQLKNCTPEEIEHYMKSLTPEIMGYAEKKAKG